MPKARTPQRRVELRIPASLDVAIDDWRRFQPDLPSKNESIRRLLEAALEAQAQQRQPARI